jgi:SNF2 family DNA or RNA helicase
MDPINGSVPPRRRQEIIDQFDKAPAGSVLVCQIQSGGTGLNIQTASVVIICEPQFKPSIENQAISRAYRMGQTRNVLVYRLLCVNSVDEKIMDMLEEKQAIFDAFADKSEAAAAHENLMLDDKNFGEIINEEIERIKKKRGDTDSSSPTV